MHRGRYSISEERWKVLYGVKYGVSEMPNLGLCGYFSSLKSLADDSFETHSQNEKAATILVEVPRSREAGGEKRFRAP